MGLAHRVIPTLLMRGDQLVKGRQFNSARSVGHIEQAMQIYSKRAADEVILLDIAATPEGRGPDLERIARLTAGFTTPVTVGGGVRTVEDVAALLRNGADKVAICSASLETHLVRATAERFGSQAMVVAIDVRRGQVHSRCGTRPYDTAPTCHPLLAQKWAEEVQRAGAGEILLTSIDREGTMQGYDIALIEEVAQAVDIPVIAHGGCACYEDMALAIRAGASAVAAGALFQFTDATPIEAARYLQEHGIEARVPA